MPVPRYLDLEVETNFSFLEGASHAEELVGRAQALGHLGIGIADRNTLAGVVRAHYVVEEERAAYPDFRLVVGSRLALRDGFELLAFPTDRAAYGKLSRLLTLGKTRAPKGECFLDLADVLDGGDGQVFVACQPERPDAAHAGRVAELARRFPRQVFQAAAWRYDGEDRRRLERLEEMARETRAPLVATNDVRYHVAERRPLADVLACIRLKTTIVQAGTRLAANAERHLKAPEEMARLFRDHPEALALSEEIAGRCRFSLKDLRYEYPDEAPTGRSAQEELEARAWAGAARRYGAGFTDKHRQVLDHELALIGERRYATYFLTVDNIVRFARSQGILCQGRGSAANSLVCYCLGVTEVDPILRGLLFERFVSSERNEPPDIDVDFEHERREEVIQHIYRHYGRDRAGIAATVISYRARSAIREVAKAMGLSADVVDVLSGTVWGYGDQALDEAEMRGAGLDPADPTLRQAILLARTLIGFPRHLSQHVGGFVITSGRLDELVPVLNAAMPDRTCIEWDKDDLDTLGILKVDVLGLGMLTCIRKGFELMQRHKAQGLTLDTIPKEDPAVYGMLQQGDSIGVFQVESRAQMAMLPRLKPKQFYDLVIEVAIVRPGPIQGDMVHPYLRRREGTEKMEPLSAKLQDVLGKTLGVPLFQEQAMRMAIDAAGFTPNEADRLRRAMATFKRNGQIESFEQKFIAGMVANGYEQGFAERCFNQIKGFSTYGFPESHAASFAILVYVSAWLKCRHPEVFAAALLNAQPMGFYAPAQIVRDATDHGVEVRPIDINASDWDCSLESCADGRFALRLGFRQVGGLQETEIKEKLVGRRGAGYSGMRDAWLRSGVRVSTLETLAAADAFRSLGLQRRDALWAVKGLGEPPLPLFAAAETRAALQAEPRMALPALGLGAEVAQDYRATSLSLKRHPMGLLRPLMDREGWNATSLLDDAPQDQLVRVAGLVLVRQHPDSAKGIVFVTIEDEGGIANLVLYQDVFERHRRVVLGSRLLACEGTIDRKDIVVHVRARRLFDLSARLSALDKDDGTPMPHDPFAGTFARGEEPASPGQLRLRSRDFR